MSRELHISSLLVQHRHDALPRLQALTDRHAELEIALHEDCRCVVLCETDDQRALMDHIDAMQNLSGVLSVSLIYHHAEPRAELEKPVQPAPPEGASA